MPSLIVLPSMNFLLTGMLAVKRRNKRQWPKGRRSKRRKKERADSRLLSSHNNEMYTITTPRWWFTTTFLVEQQCKFVMYFTASLISLGIIRRYPFHVQNIQHNELNIQPHHHILTHFLPSFIQEYPALLNAVIRIMYLWWRLCTAPVRVLGK